MPLYLTEQIDQLAALSLAQRADPLRLNCARCFERYRPSAPDRKMIAEVFEKYGMTLLGPPLNPD
jgi:hypothetical protein